METKTKKKFDAVKMMRDIRNKIDRELQSMTSEQRQEYYAKQRGEFEKWKMAKKVTGAKNP
jgi:hypothetical protein